MRYSTSSANPNRERFFRAASVDPARVLGVELMHTRRVLAPASAVEHRLLEAEAASEGGADGIVLPPGSGLWASVTVADCMPIWILDRASGACGILHSGWKGTGILEAGVGLMAERFGARPADLSVILGPAIGPCCYDVPPERAASFAAEFGAESAPTLGGSPRIDLRSANVSLARRLGIGALLSIEACTACDARLGSFRREGAERFTRMVAAVGEA